MKTLKSLCSLLFALYFLPGAKHNRLVSCKYGNAPWHAMVVAGQRGRRKNLTYNLQEYARAGLGSIEITPIYSVQGNDKNDIPFFSEKWMAMLKYTEAEFPGWKFYASIDMSPTNSIWKDAPALFQYITRCQSFLQSGKPDNDFLVYLPVYDVWHEQGAKIVFTGNYPQDVPGFADLKISRQCRFLQFARW